MTKKIHPAFVSCVMLLFLEESCLMTHVSYNCFSNFVYCCYRRASGGRAPAWGGGLIRPNSARTNPIHILHGSPQWTRDPHRLLELSCSSQNYCYQVWKVMPIHSMKEIIKSYNEFINSFCLFSEQPALPPSPTTWLSRLRSLPLALTGYPRNWVIKYFI